MMDTDQHSMAGGRAYYYRIENGEFPLELIIPDNELAKCKLQSVPGENGDTRIRFSRVDAWAIYLLLTRAFLEDAIYEPNADKDALRSVLDILEV